MVYLAVAGPVARKPNETSDRLYCNGLPAKWLQRHNLHTFFLYSLKVGACLWGLDLWPALTLREVYDYLPQKSNTPILGPTWPECTPPTRRARISDWWRGRNVLFKARELLQDSLTRAVNKTKLTAVTTTWVLGEKLKPQIWTLKTKVATGSPYMRCTPRWIPSFLHRASAHKAHETPRSSCSSPRRYHRSRSLPLAMRTRKPRPICWRLTSALMSNQGLVRRAVFSPDTRTSGSGMREAHALFPASHFTTEAFGGTVVAVTRLK